MNAEEKQILLSILEELKQIRILLNFQTKALRSQNHAGRERTKAALVQLTANLPPGMKDILAPLLNDL